MSERNDPILIVDGDEKARRVMAAFLEARMAEHAGFPRCEVVTPDCDAVRDTDSGVRDLVCIGGGDTACFQRPLRLGALVERLFLIERSRNQAKEKQFIAVGPYVLDPVFGRLLGDDGVYIDLTDKECEVLVMLHAHKGAAVERQVLLRDVWGYVDDLETHTLETHIYRLRQKIEENPAMPVILITKGDGYALAGGF